MASYKWLRKVTAMEEFLVHANKKGHFVTAYALSLRSAAPLKAVDVKKSLLYTFRKVPSMRLCFRERDDALWACEMNRDDINFEEMDSQDVIAATESLMSTVFPTAEGPLWLARLLPQGVSQKYDLLDMEDSFPHHRTLLLCNHHGIADGTTNMFMCNVFLRVLDDVLAGKPIDDKTQEGRLVAGEETDALVEAKKKELMEEKDGMKRFLEKTKKLNTQEKALSKAFPGPLNPNYKNEIVNIDFGRDLTQRFIKTCKKEGVTVNSGFCSLLNCSFVDFVRGEGVEEDAYHLFELHTVSMRRYWKGNTKGTLGVHMSIFTNTVATIPSWRDDFWSHAKTVHANMLKSLENKDAVLYVIKGLSGGPMEDMFDQRPLPECDYGAANMGIVENLIKVKGEKVCIGHMMRCTSCGNDPLYYLIHTMHGCLSCSMTFANDVLSKENATKYKNILIANMEEVSRDV